jgi:beta-glucosidase
MEKYLDKNLPFLLRAADLVSKLTPEEKILQLGSSAPAIPRLGIRSFNYWNEASHGVIPVFQFFEEATSFPACLALSSTWNPELVEAVAAAISDEMRALYNLNGKELSYWCPTVNMGRDTRWGRNDEAFGEDPLLAGKLAAAYVRGIQGYDEKYLKAVLHSKAFRGQQLRIQPQFRQLECRRGHPERILSTRFRALLQGRRSKIDYDRLQPHKRRSGLGKQVLNAAHTL